MGGYFVWVVLTLIALIAVPLSMRVRDVPAPRYQVADEMDEDGDGFDSSSPLARGGHDAGVEVSSEVVIQADETPRSSSPSQ